MKTFKTIYFLRHSVKFCKSVGISTIGLKNELSERIELFLRTGEIDRINVRKMPGKPDSEAGLSLDALVINYKSDPKTRTFFQQHIPEFTGFSAQVQKWVTERLAQNDKFTYGEIIEEHRAYLSNKKQATIQGKAVKVAHDSCQYNQFQIDYACDTDFKVHSAREAWKLGSLYEIAPEIKLMRDIRRTFMKLGRH